MAAPHKRRTGYRRPHAIHGVLDPARAIICEVLYRALLDWKAVRRSRGVRWYEPFWPREEWQELGIEDPQSELLNFFLSREFNGMCEWIDLDPDAVRSALGVSADLRVV